MEKYLKKIKPQHYWIVAFVLTTITYTMTFSYMGMLGNGKYIIARSDLKQQYIPFIEYFCSVLRGEHDYWFSWSLNLGTGTALLFAYYTLSPLNLVYLILGEGMELTATAIVVVLKASIAAATFQIFITRYLKKEYYETVMFAMMYALCGFQVCYYFNMIWMDAFYMLPIICIGILNLLREKKYFGLLLSYAYVFAVNFYMGYIVGISSFILFIFVFLYSFKEKKPKENIVVIIKYFGSVISAMMLTAAVWLPAVIRLFDNREENYPVFSLHKCNLLFLINNLLMGQMQTLNGVTPFVYCGLLVFLLMPTFFINKKIPKKKRLYYLYSVTLFIALFLIEPLNRMMHAFDEPEMFGHRFSFVFSFLLLVICCEQFLYIRKVKKAYLYIMFGICSGVFLLCHFLYPVVWNEEYNANTWIAFAVNVLFLTIWMCVIGKVKNKKWDTVTRRVLFTFVLMLELGINAAICMDNMEHTVSKQDDYEGWNELYNNTYEKIKEEEQEHLFYRILHINPRALNQGFLYDHNSFENFNSAEHKASWNAMEKLGIGRSVHIMRGQGTTAVTRALLNIKYCIGGNSIEGEIGSDILTLSYEKNQHVLALGYMVNDKILEYEFETSPFVNQDNLLSAMTGTEIQCYNKTAMELNIENGKYVKTDDASYLLHEEGSEMDSVFKYTTKDIGKPLYVYLSQDRYVDNTGGADMPEIVTKDTTPMLENTVIKSELLPQRIIPVGLNGESEYEFSIVLPQELEGDYYKKAYFCYYDDNEFQKAYELLNKHQWNITHYKDGYIEGNILVEEEGIMFTSIPYDEGWTAFVDEKEVECIPLLDNAFVGIQLEEGEHYIEMCFEPMGKREGIVISGMTSVLLIGIYSFCRMHEKKNCTKNTKIDKIHEKM